MNRTLPVDDIQNFVKIIGINNQAWNLLLGRDVIHFVLGRGEFISVNKNYTVITVGYSSNGSTYINPVNYERKLFVKEFRKIDPPFSMREIFEFIQPEEEEKRKRLSNRLLEIFRKDFLNAYSLYKTKYFTDISITDFQDLKVNFVKDTVQHYLNFEPDSEQAAAIGEVEGHVQVVARAGSGKTSTLINRAIFLQQHCGVKTNEMLLLAFNRDAVEKIRKDLTEQLSDNHIPHILTFHALAYALVHPEYNL